MDKTHSTELRIRPDLLGRIMSSWESYSHIVDDEKSTVTSYWKEHLSYISITRISDDGVRVTGQSGFYFPGHSYSGLDMLNSLVAFLRFFPRFIKTTLNYDWLRVLDHITAIRKANSRPFSRVAEIGSGTGILALAFKRIFPNVRYTCIDLPGTLHLASCFLSSEMPDARFIFPNEYRGGNSSDADFVFVDNTMIDRIEPESQELYINTDSMQEMSPAAIQEYFALMRRTLTGPRLFYQSNRASKRMDDDVIEPARFPWQSSDRHLFFRENEFMRFVFSRRWKWGIPYIVPVSRNHLRSLTMFS